MPKNKKEIFDSKVASHILCSSVVCKLQHECEDITKNARRTPLNMLSVISNCSVV